MNQINPEECKELAERLGLCWHEEDDFIDSYCKKCKEIRKANPNFRDPVVVLREAVKMEDWQGFHRHITNLIAPGWAIPIDYLLDDNGEPERKGKLAKALLEWMRKEKS